MNSLIQFKTRTLLLFLSMLGCFMLSPKAQAVTGQDGAYGPSNRNTAEGFQALSTLNPASITAGLFNTAVGQEALFTVTTGNRNTAVGTSALNKNTNDSNTAVGIDALNHNTSGHHNTAVGDSALFSNVGGTFSHGQFNTAVGVGALKSNTTGFENTALGINAGSAITTGSGDIVIGAGIGGVAGENNITRIGNISSTPQNSGILVTMDQINGTKLGRVVVASSQRYKEGVKPIGKASEALLALKPVAFRYKAEIDPDRAERFGLIAEEVEKVNPDLVVRDQNGRANVVRYDSVNAMLLNEFLKEHRKVEQLEKQVEALTAGLQKVSAQLEATKPAPQMVLNNQ